MKANSQLEILNSALDGLRLHIEGEEESTSNADFAESSIRDIKEREEELLESWCLVRSLLSVPGDVQAITAEEARVRASVYESCSKAQLFISKVRANSIPDDVASTTSSSTTHHQSSTKLEKMQPPKFSGNIRDYARFKANSL